MNLLLMPSPHHLAAALWAACAVAVQGLHRRTHGEDERVAPTAPDNVPFYMYPLPEWSIGCDTNWAHHQNNYPDVAMYQVMDHHPWRVHDPAAAKLFVISGFFSLSQQGMCGNHTSNMISVLQTLLKLPYLMRNQGRDHLLSAFAFQMDPGNLGALKSLADNFIVAHYERRDFEHAVPVPYGPVSVRGMAFSLPEWDSRPGSLFFIGQADHRWSYRTRRRALHYLPEHYANSTLVQVPSDPREAKWHVVMDAWDDPPSLKTELPMCDEAGRLSGCVMRRNYDGYVALGRRTKYSLVIHGDTPSTSRLYDSLQFSQIPLMISERFKLLAMPFDRDLPWDEIVVWLNQTNFHLDPVGTMADAVTRAAEPDQLAMWMRARPFLDWSMGSPCIGTALLSDVARKFLNMTDLPPAWLTQDCERRIPGKNVTTQLQRDVNMTILKEILVDGRFA